MRIVCAFVYSMVCLLKIEDCKSEAEEELQPMPLKPISIKGVL